MQKLSSKFTALAVLGQGEFIGLSFKSVADVAIFNMRLTELEETLTADEMKSKAIREIAKNREKEIEKKSRQLAKDIDYDMLIKGIGDGDHERELNKFLAACGISTEDKSNKDLTDLI